MRPLTGHCHAGQGRLHARAGGREPREHLATAAEWYREMDMPSWLDQDAADLKALA